MSITPRFATEEVIWIEKKENELVQFIVAREELEHFHALVLLLYQRGAITEDAKLAFEKRFRLINDTLWLGTKNTSDQRNGRPA